MPPSPPLRPSEQRKYDVSNICDLLVADVEIDLHPHRLADSTKEKFLYYLSRAYDMGRASK